MPPVFSFPSLVNEESLIGVSKPLPKQLWEAKKVRASVFVSSRLFCVFAVQTLHMEAALSLTVAFPKTMMGSLEEQALWRAINHFTGSSFISSLLLSFKGFCPNIKHTCQHVKVNQTSTCWSLVRSRSQPDVSYRDGSDTFFSFPDWFCVSVSGSVSGIKA